MKKILNTIKEGYKLPKILLGLLAYLLILGVYMQPVIANGCNETYLGGPGDQSAFAWLYEASPDTPPLWGKTTWTNAPYGENVSEPFYISGLAQYTSVWTLEKAVGPTCAFNLYASFGFLFTATVIFFFVLWLLQRRSYFIPWFAGYLVAFSPYLQMKTPYHVSYVYAGLLVLIVWLFLLMWMKPAFKYALGLTLLGALMFYHDPYFIMLTIFTVLALLVGTTVHHLLYKKMPKDEIWKRLKPLLLCIPIFLVLIAPVIYTRIAHNSQIETVVGQSRDTNIMDEGRAYGARPWEFLLPAATNPFSPQKLKDVQLSRQHGATPTETTLFLGFIPLALATIFVVFWLRRGRKSTGLIWVRNRQVILVSAALVVIGGLMALPPTFTIGGVTLYFPSWLLLELTNMWRVPARFFVMLHIGLVILASFGLYFLLEKYGKRLRRAGLYALYGTLLVLSVMEFATFNPFDRQYWAQSMTPGAYQEIKDNASVDRIAEYPMLDPPRNGAFIYYVTYQAYHEKSMINTAKAGSPTKQYRESLANLYGWQTAGVLKQLGVDRVVLHDEKLAQLDIPSFTRMKSSVDTQTNFLVTSFAPNADVQPKAYVLTISDGFDGPSNFGFKDVEYYMHQFGVLKPVLLPGASVKDSVTARIEFYAFNANLKPVAFTQDGKTIQIVTPQEGRQTVELPIDPTKPIRIVPTNPTDDYSFVVSNMEIN